MSTRPLSPGASLHPSRPPSSCQSPPPISLLLCLIRNILEPPQCPRLPPAPVFHTVTTAVILKFSPAPFSPPPQCPWQSSGCFLSLSRGCESPEGLFCPERGWGWTPVQPAFCPSHGAAGKWGPPGTPGNTVRRPMTRGRRLRNSLMTGPLCDLRSRLQSHFPTRSC